MHYVIQNCKQEKRKIKDQILFKDFRSLQAHPFYIIKIEEKKTLADNKTFSIKS